MKVYVTLWMLYANDLNIIYYACMARICRDYAQAFNAKITYAGIFAACL